MGNDSGKDFIHWTEEDYAPPLARLHAGRPLGDLLGIGTVGKAVASMHSSLGIAGVFSEYPAPGLLAAMEAVNTEPIAGLIGGGMKPALAGLMADVIATSNPLADMMENVAPSVAGALAQNWPVPSILSESAAAFGFLKDVQSAVGFLGASETAGSLFSHAATIGQWLNERPMVGLPEELVGIGPQMLGNLPYAELLTDEFVDTVLNNKEELFGSEHLDADEFAGQHPDIAQAVSEVATRRPLTATEQIMLMATVAFVVWVSVTLGILMLQEANQIAEGFIEDSGMEPGELAASAAATGALIAKAKTDERVDRSGKTEEPET